MKGKNVVRGFDGTPVVLLVWEEREGSIAVSAREEYELQRGEAGYTQCGAA